MVKAAVSEFKAKLASYLRLIKSGEQVEIQDRGITVAFLTGLPQADSLNVIKPTKNPQNFSQFKSKVSVKNFDVVDILLEDRKKR